jgi:hypothetical protein
MRQSYRYSPNYFTLKFDAEAGKSYSLAVMHTQVRRLSRCRPPRAAVAQDAGVDPLGRQPG